MNCKPGQLAIIVKGMDNGQKHIGKIIRVTKLHRFSSGCWEYEGEKLPTPNGDPIVCIEDECLRPIDNPGDDAVDESLAWKPVPTKEPALGHCLDEVKANIADLNEMRKYCGNQS